MAVLDRSELQASPLADLHAIADQLGLEGFRRMRKADLIDAILSHGSSGDAGRGERASDGGREGASDERGGEASDERGNAASDNRGEDESESTGSRTRRSPFRTRRTRRARTAPEGGGAAPTLPEGGGHDEDGGDGAAPEERTAAPEERTPAPKERTATGVVELLGNGSAFLRVNPPDSSEDDVYISAAQVRRCELVSGDRVSGPLRTPRRSERYPSLVRVETINDVPAGEVADAGRYEDRPVAYASELLSLEGGAAGVGDPGRPDERGGLGGPIGLRGADAAGVNDPVLRAIAQLAPFGRGSRVIVAGPPRSGKTTVLRKLLRALAGREDLDVTLVLTGVRPEEISEYGEGGVVAGSIPAGAPGTSSAAPGTSGTSGMWGVSGGAPGVPSVPVAPVVALSFAASADTQDQAVVQAVETAKRIAARGGDALVCIDTLDGLHPHTARKVMAGARNLRDGGSLTIIATATRPLGGETTVIALDPESSVAAEGPSLDARASGTVRAELLVGEVGAAG